MSDLDDLQRIAEQAVQQAKKKTNMRSLSEPINWGDLHCVSAEFVKCQDGSTYYRVLIEEAAAESCPRLCEFIGKELAKEGWENVEVATTW